MLWRRSYDTPPPPLADGTEFSQSDDPRYAAIPPELRPRTECLKDVVVRMLPYWYDGIVPDLLAGHTVLVAAHGNSLRAIIKLLFGLSADQILHVEVPTGNPLLIDLDDGLKPTAARYLDAARAQRLPRRRPRRPRDAASTRRAGCHRSLRTAAP